MRKRTIRYKSYPVSVNVIWCDDLAVAAEAVRKLVPKLDEVDDSRGAAAMCLHSEKRPYEAWILLSLKPKPGEIAHEAVHAAHFLLKDIGIKSCPDNDEPLAYMVQWIVDELSK